MNLLAIEPPSESYFDLLRSGPHWLFELTLEIASIPIVFAAGWVWRNRILRHVHQDLSILHTDQNGEASDTDDPTRCPGQGTMGASAGPAATPREPGESRASKAGERTRIPITMFGLPFGLSGLAGTWAYASREHYVPPAVGTVLMAAAGATWALLVVLYVNYALRHPGTWRADLDDATTGPFTSLTVLTPMLLLASYGGPGASDAVRLVFDILVVLMVLLAAWLAGEWVAQPTSLDRIHPGYLLPAVAGGFVAAIGAATLGQEVLAQAMFGLAIASWVGVGALVLVRLASGSELPDSLAPTLSIQVAPGAVGSLAWFSLNGGQLDAIAAGFAGYGVLMSVAQLPLIPRYRRLAFGPSFWAFTFPATALATATLHWVSGGRPGDSTVLAYLVLVSVTTFVTLVAAWTGRALRRRELLTPVAPRKSSGSGAGAMLGSRMTDALNGDRAQH